MKDNFKTPANLNIDFVDINKTSIRGSLKCGKNVKIE